MDGSGSANDDLTREQALAVVGLLLILLTPVALALAYWAKHRYARAVTRLQSSVVDLAPTAIPDDVLDDRTRTPLPPLQLQVLDLASLDGDLPPPAARAQRLRHRVLRRQFIGGLLLWLALLLLLVVGLALQQSASPEAAPSQAVAQQSAASQSAAAQAGAASATQAEAEAEVEVMGWREWHALWLTLLPMLVMPAFLAWGLQSGVREVWVWSGWGLSALAAWAGLLLAGAELLGASAFVAGAALLGMSLASLMRPATRGAGPPLLAALGMAVAVCSAVMAVLVVWDPHLPGSSLDEEAWTSGDTLWAIAVALGFAVLAVGVAAWVLRGIARRYEARAFSDAQLAHGSYWATLTLFAAGGLLLLSFDESKVEGLLPLTVLALAAWGVWRWAMMRSLKRPLAEAPPALPALLMLRVFKPSHRSEAFTDRLLARWRFAAPVWMIAGPDLAGACMEPDEFFDWLGRRLHQRFITGAGSLARRLERLNGQRDPDGRCRIDELFCANSAWQHAARALIARAGVVLLDLREYAPERAGTRFELAELLLRAPLERVLLLVDAQQALPALQAEIQSLWQASGRRGMGGADGRAPSLRLLRLQQGSHAEMTALYGLLAGAAAAAAAGAVPATAAAQQAA